ncbi:alpha-galactosidase-like protein [Dyadobacter jejuensis]|uniref:Alpha-galactosidase-like protein n=1 Tax=Dyadobacter jejuensis TaxID=1082580 RepID=A0A316ACL5_9BACT|nr:NEW3 domain-containing protein [Dyadobacter jejuensis]PWJ54720.1 alpha-galactosidase-like protein [Dyadobacter jejuensis]
MTTICPNSKKYNLQFYGLLVFFISGLLTTTHLFAQVPNATGGTSSFKANLMNIEATANETFRYNTVLYNGTSETKIYQLQAQVPDGWSVTYMTMGSPVTSVSVEAKKSQDVTIELKARPDSKPSKYSVLVTATSASDSLTLNLEAALKGAYGIELTTPTGRLSDELTEGSTKEIHLVVRNSATLPLENVELTAQSPSHWDVTFEPSKIDRLDPNKTVDVKAKVKVPDKTIAGDYITTFTAKNTNASANSTFRITVKTSLLSGWIGIIVILLSIGLVYSLIRKYGRR